MRACAGGGERRSKELNEKIRKTILMDHIEALAHVQDVLAESLIERSNQCLTVANLLRGIINMMQELSVDDCVKLMDKVITMLPRDQGGKKDMM